MDRSGLHSIGPFLGLTSDPGEYLRRQPGSGPVRSGDGVLMNGGEPVQNLPRSLKDEGHKGLRIKNNRDGTYTLVVEKAG